MDEYAGPLWLPVPPDTVRTEMDSAPTAKS